MKNSRHWSGLPSNAKLVCAGPLHHIPLNSLAVKPHPGSRTALNTRPELRSQSTASTEDTSHSALISGQSWLKLGSAGLNWSAKRPRASQKRGYQLVRTCPACHGWSPFSLSRKQQFLTSCRPRTTLRPDKNNGSHLLKMHLDIHRYVDNSGSPPLKAHL